LTLLAFRNRIARHYFLQSMFNLCIEKHDSPIGFFKQAIIYFVTAIDLRKSARL
jgi:hypothetical protein